MVKMEIKQQLPTTQLFYSQLLEQCKIAAPSGHGVSFVQKKVKGRVYWYLQSRLGNRQTQHYVGATSPEIQRRVELEKQLWKNAEPDIEKRQKLVALLQTGGAFVVNRNEARLFELLERWGGFLVGGVLVGTYAFNLYQNILGVQWQTQTDSLIETVDNSCLIKIGFYNQDVNLKEALLKSGMGMFKISALKQKESFTTFFMHGQEMKVNILTPKFSEPPDKPIFLKSLNVSATPVPFLEFLLEEVQPAVVVTNTGTLVDVPSPARYALYKLVLSQSRGPSEEFKSKTDIAQAKQLLSVLIEKRQGDVELAIEAAKFRTVQFYELLLKGISQLPVDLQEWLNNC